ncbi:hypothetical protein PYCC9005_004596 [Savitreella phatthalungensis]
MTSTVKELHDVRPRQWCESDSKLNVLKGTATSVETLIVTGGPPDPAAPAQVAEHRRLWKKVCEVARLDPAHQQYHEAFSLLQPFGSTAMLKAILNAHEVSQGTMPASEAAELLDDHKALARSSEAPRDALARLQKAQDEALGDRRDLSVDGGGYDYSVDSGVAAAVYFSCSYVARESSEPSHRRCRRPRCFDSTLRTYAGATWSLKRRSRYPARFLAHSDLAVRDADDDSLWQHILRSRLPGQRHRHVVFVALCARHGCGRQVAQQPLLPPPPPPKGYEFVDAAETLVCAASKSFAPWSGGGNAEPCHFDVSRYRSDASVAEAEPSCCFPLLSVPPTWESPVTLPIARQIIYSASRLEDDGARHVKLTAVEREYYRRSMLMATMRYHAEASDRGLTGDEIAQIIGCRRLMKSTWAFQNDNGSAEMRRLLAEHVAVRPTISSTKRCEEFIDSWVRGRF